jgi:hypothetical protein
MKLYPFLSICCGIAAAFALLTSLVALFTQPFAATVTNDRVFFSLFLTGCAFVALFLKFDNLSHPKHPLAR